MTGGRVLGPGERAPDFVAPGPGGAPARFYGRAGGRPTALLFSDDGAALRAVAARLAGRQDIAAWAVSRAPHDSAVPAWADPDGTVRTRYGLPDTGSVALILDPNLRIVAVLTGDDVGASVIDRLDGLHPTGPAVEVAAQAPVLFVPDALNRDHRSKLIELWAAEGNTETGVERSADGVRREAVERDLKRRRDHLVRDQELLRELTSVVGRTVLPEVHRAFGFRATRFEGFKIGCYDASTGGYFRAHRDNLTPATAHRAFALTLNLSEDYDGGALRFPEYGNQLYRPDAGAALVFSCSLLHEVVEIRRGRRFVLLSFLSGSP